jgi:DNA-directed RNA polymerase specialized sigma24 family protein
LEFSELTQDQQQQLLDRLTIYAERKYTRLGWYKNWGYRSPSGQGPDDVAAEAIVRLIEGRRNYDEQKHPDLLVYLRSVVDSIVSHVIESADFEKRKSMPHVVAEDGEIEEIEIESGIPDASLIYMQKDLVERINAILQEKFAKDDVVLGILECMKAGIDTPSEIAEYLDLKTKDVNNAQKRLRREFDKIRSTI